MMSKLTLLGLLTLGLLPAAAAFAVDGDAIQIWTRTPGQYAEGREVKPTDLKEVTLSKLKQTEVENFDIQYNKSHTYRGVHLARILSRYKVPAQVDLALLHFANGMIVPIYLQDAQAKGKKSEVFVALKIRQQKKWTTAFPEVAKTDDIRYRKDPNPIRFGGNKVVSLHPKSAFYLKDEKKKGDQKIFTPWSHVTSLVGIELVNEQAYYRQFDIANTPKAAAGLQVFRDRCQYCHGVRKVGASFGWDYVDPLKISEKRSKKSLHQLVKYPKVDPVASGSQMPSQPDLQPEETVNLWEWIRLAGQKPLRKYEP